MLSMIKFNTEETSIRLGVWLLWRMLRQHVAWGSSHRWAGIFFCVQVV